MQYKKGKLIQMIALVLVMLMVVTSAQVIPVHAKEVRKGQQETVYVGEGYEVVFKIASQWSGAFNADVTVKNTSKQVIDNWAIGFAMPYEVTNIWNGVVKDKGEGYYIIKNVGSNQDIAAGKSINFGFTANYENEVVIPKTFILLMNQEEVSKSDYETSFKVTSDWKSAFNGEISIINTSGNTIEDWILEFDFSYSINSFFTAEIISNASNHYVVKNAGYNANIKPGQTLKLGFSGKPGNVTGKPENIKLKQVVTKKDKLQEDYDNDSLTNEMELYLETDIYKKDTDGDGIDDYKELTYGLSPLKRDTDGNGIVDGDEDLDGDGLSIIQEFQYGTDNQNKDTDWDGLNDYEEIFIYGTNPLVADTDGDGIDDGSEIKLGLDPLSKDSDGDGVLDGNEKIEQIIRQPIESKEAGQIRNVSVTMKGTGDLEKTTTIENTFGKDTLSSEVVGLIGVPVEIESTSVFDTATITFTYDESLLGTVKEENLRVMWYDEENNQYVIMDEDTVLDTHSNTVSYTTTHFSTYMVVDRQAWYDVWSNALSYRRKPDIPYIPTEYFDICYVIDRSGSMAGTRITTAKEAIGNFVDAMYTNDRGAIVGFESSARVYSNFTSDKTVLRNSLSSITATGGTNVESGLVAGLNLFDSASTNSKMMILLCDGDVYYTQATLQRAKDNGIKIYTVLIGSTSGQAALQNIAEVTGGKFYYAATADEIRKAIFGVQEDTIGEIDTTDTDGDGLYDIYETAGMILPNGKYVYTNPQVRDSDGDGLTDAEEMGALTEFSEQSSLKQFILKLAGFNSEVYAEYFDYKSDPTKKDTDGDGYKDKEDPYPLKNNVHVVSLKDAVKFVEIWDGSTNYYGGDQDWYSSKVAQNGACGTVAAANITAYMARNNSTYADLYDYPDLSKGNFLAHMNDMYDYLSPFYIPFTSVALGIWPMSKFEGGVEKFSKSKGVAFNGVHDNSRFNKKNITNYIINGLEADAPVAMLIGFNGDFKNIDVQQPNGHKWTQSSFDKHWVVITEIKVDDIKQTTTVKVSTWGGYSYLDIDTFLNGESVYQCLLYFK